jgi:hypothetical protein
MSECESEPENEQHQDPPQSTGEEAPQLILPIWQKEPAKSRGLKNSLSFVFLGTVGAQSVCRFLGKEQYAPSTLLGSAWRYSNAAFEAGGTLLFKLSDVWPYLHPFFKFLYDDVMVNIFWATWDIVFWTTRVLISPLGLISSLASKMSSHWCVDLSLGSATSQLIVLSGIVFPLMFGSICLLEYAGGKAEKEVWWGFRIVRPSYIITTLYVDPLYTVFANGYFTLAAFCRVVVNFTQDVYTLLKNYIEPFVRPILHKAQIGFRAMAPVSNYLLTAIPEGIDTGFDAATRGISEYKRSIIVLTSFVTVACAVAYKLS